MDEEANTVSMWRSVSFPAGVSPEAILRAAYLSHLREQVRIGSTPDGIMQIEILVDTRGQYSRVEAFVRQALDDELLRHKISQKATHQVAALVDSVLAPSNGG